MSRGPERKRVQTIAATPAVPTHCTSCASTGGTPSCKRATRIVGIKCMISPLSAANWRENAGSEAAQLGQIRSEEHTSELQSLTNLVCRLLLEKKKKNKTSTENNVRNTKE